MHFFTPTALATSPMATSSLGMSSNSISMNVSNTVANTPTNTSGSATFIDLFLGADWVVQSVIIVLLIASIGTWAIIFAKSTHLRQLNRAADSFEDEYWTSSDRLRYLEHIKRVKQMDPMRLLFISGMQECTAGTQKETMNHHNYLERVDRMLGVTLRKELDELDRHMPFLASVGSTAAFVGLFGTVWGIMHSFSSIAASQSTNLAVVAPGIAEALFATAMGLIAAIPAVLAYNRLSASIARYTQRLEGFIDEFLTALSREKS